MTAKHDSMEDLTPIQQFYSNTNIFITGATGFLGTILLEKLLRSCPNISTIYILVRNKKGKNSETRLNEFFNGVVFENIKKEDPNIFKKVIGISGDCELPDLGLSPEDKNLIASEVNIVFHLSATVSFTEKLKKAVNINVRATRDLVRLAQKMSKLKSFLHVSTAFSNCVKNTIEEKVYPTNINYNHLIYACEHFDDKILDAMTELLTVNYPNTYSYTKQIAEEAVALEGKGLPIGIFRPSIVLCTYKEPVKGWNDSPFNIMGLLLGSGVGLIKTLHINLNLKVHIIPVDMVGNCCIAAAWQNENISQNAGENLEHSVYNYDSAEDKPVTWDAFQKQLFETLSLYPFCKAVWYPSTIFTKHHFLYVFLKYALHIVPALIVDGVLSCLGKTPGLMKIYSKIHKMDTLFYFGNKEWNFENKNIQRLVSKMTVKDRNLFFCDIKRINWDEFWVALTTGLRKYFLNDPLETVPQAKIKHRRLYWLDKVTKIVVGFFLLWIFWLFVSMFL